jgi:hypothetical protein
MLCKNGIHEMTPENTSPAGICHTCLTLALWKVGRGGPSVPSHKERSSKKYQLELRQRKRKRFYAKFRRTPAMTQSDEKPPGKCSK